MGRTDRALRAALQTVIDTIYPAHCLACGETVAGQPGLCGACFGDTTFITGLVCDSCGVPLPGQSTQAEQCDDCLKIARPWHRGRAALHYSGQGRALVLGLKHADRLETVSPAAGWMARALDPILPENPVFVPVPLHPWRLLRRRYNQSGLLAQAIARKLTADCAPGALCRPLATPVLDGKTRDERFTTMAGRIAPHPKRGATLKGRNVVLIDDVMTSGATLAAATEGAHGAGAQQVCIGVLARVAKDT